MSLNLTFTGPPLPVTERGRPTKIYVHKDGDTVIYANKTAVIARSLSDPSKIPTVYTQHRAKVTVAKFSPNGNYVASGDESGKVRIWAYTHEEHLLKKEVSTVGRGVRDVDWDGEGKRVVACGDGDKKAIAFSWDSGSELGKMTGMSTPACGVAFKNERPYRIVVGCEDKKAYFFSGPPFKPAGIKREHKNMITSVAFSPDGSKFITVGSDKTGHFYDGKSGDPIGKLSNKKKDRHNGTIYAVDFSPDNASVLTASSDKTNKLWDAGSGALITTLVVGGPKAQIRDQQVGGVFSAHGPVSVSLSGEIHIFNPESPDAPARTLQGHQATPGALALDSNGNPWAEDNQSDGLHMEKVSLGLVEDMTVGDAVNFFTIHEAPYRPYATYLARACIRGPIVQPSGPTVISNDPLETMDRESGPSRPNGRVSGRMQTRPRRKPPGPQGFGLRPLEDDDSENEG